MSAHAPGLPLEADPLIAEAKQRARRRRLLVTAALLAVGAVAGGVLVFGARGSSGGDIPWLATRPQLGPANPPFAPACRASQLRGKLGLQGGGFGRLVGPLMVENRSSTPCALVGMPKLSIAGATSRWRLQRGPQENAYDPLTPPAHSLRALAPGRWAATNLRWGNWCGRGSSSYTSQPGRLPRAIVLIAPGGGTISLGRTPFFQGITCASARGGSVLEAGRFSPIVPQGPPSTALPLQARIVSAGTAHPGTWLWYTVVLTNRSTKPFSFGRSCPAYYEGFGLRPAAYVLNCHAVGPIAPRRSAGFAMRVFVPRHAHLNTLTWTLAPHSWGGGVLATSRP